MIETIFHGSDHVIEQPIYGLGKPYNDYGLGFYCTLDKDMAKEWGANPYSDGYANRYEINLSNLSILNLNEEPYCILHWLTVLLQNRTFDVSSPLALEAKQYLFETFALDYTSPDIIIGYRADDSYFAFAQDFINGAISYRQLRNAMYLGQLGEQFVLKSLRAFSAITFQGYEVAEQGIWLAKRELRDRNARREYFDIERFRRQPGDLFIANLIDGKIGPDHDCLR